MVVTYHKLHCESFCSSLASFFFRRHFRAAALFLSLFSRYLGSDGWIDFRFLFCIEKKKVYQNKYIISYLSKYAISCYSKSLTVIVIKKIKCLIFQTCFVGCTWLISVLSVSCGASSELFSKFGQ